MTREPDALRTGGRLLVAAGHMDDPNFRRTVVLLVEHDDDGALGLVLNRPVPMPLPEALARWEEFLAPPGQLFLGGPVSPERVLCVTFVGAGAVGAGTGAGEATPADRAGAAMRLLDPTTDPATQGVAPGGVRLFAGYAGWSSAQLEDEIAAGWWYLLPQEPVDLLTAAPRELWSAVLRRQGGGLGILASMPDDASLN